MPVPEQTYVVSGGTWRELVNDLRRQIYERVHRQGRVGEAARRLGVDPATLWRWGNCHSVTDSDDG